MVASPGMTFQRLISYCQQDLSRYIAIAAGCATFFSSFSSIRTELTAA